jgi:hypothetical protein
MNQKITKRCKCEDNIKIDFWRKYEMNLNRLGIGSVSTALSKSDTV